MLRKLVATGIVFGVGYVVGVLFGFRAAVVDYVENDAEAIEEKADDLYPSPEEGAAQNLPQAVNEAIEEANNQKQAEENNTADDGTPAFQ